MQPLEPQLGVLLLVVGRFIEDLGDLDIAILALLGGIKRIFIARLALACKSRHQIGFCFASLEFHPHSILSCVTIPGIVCIMTGYGRSNSRSHENFVNVIFPESLAFL